MPILECTMAEYLALPGLSSSGARRMLQSPAHYQEGKTDDTKALRDGTTTHAALLEPADFAARYQEAPEGDKRTKAVKEAWAIAEAEAAEHGRELITKAEMEMVQGIRNAIWAVPAVAGLVTRSQREVTITFDQHLVPCRARLDMLLNNPARRVISDLKTCQDARPKAFARAVEDHGYATQAAWYIEAANDAFGPAPTDFLWLAVEKEPPYGFAVYRATEEWLEEGRRDMIEALRLWRKCTNEGRWPAYITDPQNVVSDLPIPAWRKPRNVQ